MGNNKYKILVVEDDVTIRSIIETILDTNGYQALTAETCGMGIMMLQSYVPDLVILDLGLPDIDGLEFIRSARKNLTVPIIVLSARSQEQDKIDALDLGANDYITKPFGTGELLARVRAALRTTHNSTEGSSPDGKLTVNDLIIDYDKRMVSVAGKEVKLTQTEYNIVALLSHHIGKVLTYSRIITEIWGCADVGSTKKLQVNMANIRKKLGSKPGEKRYIINELGVGYRMCDENDQ